MRQKKNVSGPVKSSQPPAQEVLQRVPQDGSISIRTGPIPTPEELLNYQRLIPGSADRIIAMAEREQAHRMNIEDLQSRADIRHRDELVAAQRQNAAGVFRSDMTGQILGAAVALAATGGAIYTAVIGAPALVSIALVSLPVAAIIKALRPNGKEQK